MAFPVLASSGVAAGRLAGLMCGRPRDRAVGKKLAAPAPVVAPVPCPYMLGFRAGEMAEDEGLRIADLVVRAVRRVFAGGLNVGVNAK
jgi:hypothetical protein